MRYVLKRLLQFIPTGPCQPPDLKLRLGVDRERPGPPVEKEGSADDLSGLKRREVHVGCASADIEVGIAVVDEKQIRPAAALFGYQITRLKGFRVQRGKEQVGFFGAEQFVKPAPDHQVMVLAVVRLEHRV